MPRRGHRLVRTRRPEERTIVGLGNGTRAEFLMRTRARTRVPRVCCPLKNAPRTLGGTECSDSNTIRSVVVLKIFDDFFCILYIFLKGLNGGGDFARQR